jgi:hypothetical protein
VGPTCQFLSLFYPSSPILPAVPTTAAAAHGRSYARVRPWPEFARAPPVAASPGPRGDCRIVELAPCLDVAGKLAGAGRHTRVRPRAASPSPGRRSSMRTRLPLAAAVAHRVWRRQSCSFFPAGTTEVLGRSWGRRRGRGRFTAR